LVVDLEKLDADPVHVVGQVEHDEDGGDHQEAPGQLEVRVAEASALAPFLKKIDFFKYIFRIKSIIKKLI
jgi:hypothetical protein